MKKQFRLYDIYRYAAMGIQSNIKGIHSYECNKTATTIVVRFSNPVDPEDDRISINRFCNNEQELRELVTEVNKRLNNCHTPGPKKAPYKQIRMQL